MAAQGWFAVTWIFRGRQRTFAPNRWVCLTIAATLPVVTAWYLVATVYFVFHDQMLVSLIGHQADLQYAYEDRLGNLQTALDRETSRSLMDRQTLDTVVRELTERSLQLESHAAMVDRLVARNLRLPANAPPPSDGRAYVEERGSAAYVDELLRLKRMPDEAPAPSGENHSEIDAPQWEHLATGGTLANILTGIGETQDHTLAALREPALRTVAKIRTALIDAGLASRLKEASAGSLQADVGGPFIPLPEAGASGAFDQNAALLDDALGQAERLNALAAKVPLRKPITGPLEVTSPFGARADPFLGRPAMHTGTDFRESYGDDVHATAAGIVTIAGTDGGYGTMVEIDHGNGLSTRYAHLSRVNVVPNQKVAAGDIVGHAGSSGRATGPHLHYETRINGDPVDPVRFLKAGAKLFGD